MNKKSWVERFRPSNINSIVQQDEINSLLKNAFKSKTVTHMLLYGPPGTGKTTTAKIICKEFYHISGENNIELNEKVLKERVLELNASDERGIKIVRDKIKNFAISSVNEYPNIPKFKIIILDEADAMTSDSQFALRRIIEKYTESTRFILICNYVTKIIPPLASRCLKLRFQSISTESLEIIIQKIAKAENLTITSEFINRLNEITRGDLRKSINLLERISFIDPELKIKSLEEISGQVNIELINNIWSTLMNKNTNMKDIVAIASEFKNLSYSSLNLLEKLFNLVLKSNKFNDKDKGKLLIEMSKIDYYLNDNANEYIQLIKLFGLIKITFNKII